MNTDLETKALSEAELDGVAGGLNPQPLPPGPPPGERFILSSFAAHFNFNRFVVSRAFNFKF